MKPYGYMLLPSKVALGRFQEMDWHPSAWSQIGYPHFYSIEEARAAQSKMSEAQMLLQIGAASKTNRVMAEMVAVEIGVSLGTFGEMVYRLLELMQANQGSISRHIITRNEALPEVERVAIDWLKNNEVVNLLKEMCFVNSDGQWYVKRNPQEGDCWQWHRAWAQMFGDASERCREWVYLMEERIDAHRNPPKPPVVREHSRAFYEEIETENIAHLRAVADLMEDWMQALWSRNWDSREVWGYLREVFRSERRILDSEIDYRMMGFPSARSSKKKTEAARRDWSRAAELRSLGTEHFYSKAFQEAFKQQSILALGVDKEHLPQDLAVNKPIAWQTERELLGTVLGVAGCDIPVNDFDYEDRELLMRKIREAAESVKAQRILKTNLKKEGASS